MSSQKKHTIRLFISYSRLNKLEVYPFVEALKAAGVEIWIDRDEIDPLDEFPARIRDGLARCHALLAWYSAAYAQSTYCQKELTAAWICAQRLTHDILSRIIVVNPEVNVSHVALGDLGKENYLAAPNNQGDLAACIESIHTRLADLVSDFAAVGDFKPPEWFPNPRQGSARFVGRLRELWDIHTALNPVGISEHEHANLVVQLRGLGGIGKSLLAIEYAKRFGAAYPGGIHWLSAYGAEPKKPMDPEACERERRLQLEHLALQHSVPILDRDFREISRDIRRQLVSGRRYLWVIDDLPAALDQERALPDWCAPSPNGCTLITTRTKDYEGVGYTVWVDVLEPRPALELLTQERKPQSERELKDAKDLAEDLGRHALALDVAGHFLLKTSDFAVLHNELALAVTGTGRDLLGELAGSLVGQLPGGHEKSIVATLLASIRMLGQPGLNFLRLACELHADTPIPKHLAREAFRYAFGLEDQEADDYLLHAVNQAEMHSLATISVGRVGSQNFSVHSLVRYTIWHGDPAGGTGLALRKQLREGAVSALVDILRDVAAFSKDTNVEMEIAHARYLVPQPSTADEARLSICLGHIEGDRGNYRDALTMEKNSFRILERELGDHHTDTLAARHNVAYWTGETGEAREALRLYRELLPDMEQSLGRDHKLTLGARCEIAFWGGQTGEVQEALRLLEDLLPDTERALGRDDPLPLRIRNNLASLRGRRGEARKALLLFRELLVDQERVLGPDHPSTLMIRSNVATWSGEIGERQQAVRLFLELLPDQERMLGRDHPNTLITRGKIATWLGAGKAHEALSLFGELLPDQERVLGPDHPHTLITRYAIATRTGQTGKVAAALQLFRQLLPDQERVMGRDHPDTLATRSNIAQQAGNSGEVWKALRLFRELQADLERAQGNFNPDTLTNRHHLAFCTGRAGKVAEALLLFRKLLPDQERVLGRDHPDTLATRSQIAFWCSETGEEREALGLYQELLPDMERVLGRAHPGTLRVRHNTALCIGHLGEIQKALHLLRELQPELEETMGHDHPDTLTNHDAIHLLDGADR
jgi:hypothetical protein